MKPQAWLSCQLRRYDPSLSLTLHHHVQKDAAHKEALARLLGDILSRSVDDRDIFSQQSDVAPGRGHRYKASLASSQIVDHILFGRRLASFVVLHVIVGEDPGEFGHLSRNQRAVAIFKDWMSCCSSFNTHPQWK